MNCVNFRLGNIINNNYCLIIFGSPNSGDFNVPNKIDGTYLHLHNTNIYNIM